jgi:hypothetical protein
MSTLNYKTILRLLPTDKQVALDFNEGRRPLIFKKTTEIWIHDVRKPDKTVARIDPLSLCTGRYGLKLGF